MLVDEMVPREAGKGFQLYWANKVKAREQAEWVLLRECVFEDLVIVLLVVNDGKGEQPGSRDSCDGDVFLLS